MFFPVKNPDLKTSLVTFKKPFTLIDYISLHPPFYPNLHSTQKNREKQLKNSQEIPQKFHLGEFKRGSLPDFLAFFWIIPIDHSWIWRVRPFFRVWFPLLINHLCPRLRDKHDLVVFKFTKKSNWNPLTKIPWKSPKKNTRWCPPVISWFIIPLTT